jgi:hypothetical protein
MMVWLGWGEKMAMQGALWSLIDESHLSEQPHQSAILELTHQLCLQLVNRAMQEPINTCPENGRGESSLLRLLHL